MKFITSEVDINKAIEAIKTPQFIKAGFLEVLSEKELLIQRYVQNKWAKELFLAKKIKFDLELNNELNTKNLAIGQLVTYCNDYGVAYPNLEIVGFDNNGEYGSYVYLNKGSYWCAIEVNSLTVQDGYIGFSQEDFDAITSEYENSFYPIELKSIQGIKA